jgi:hypothetical protein
MARRITIMLDEAIEKKLRTKQAKLITKTNSGVTFSGILNSTLRECLK